MSIITPGVQDPKAYQRQAQAEVKVTSAQVLALNATPITLVAAPGADYAAIFEGAIIYKPAGTAYAGIAGGEDLSVKYTDGSGLAVGQAEATGFLDQTGAETRWVRAFTAASADSSIEPVANAVLVLHLLSGELTTGNSDLHVRVYYRVIPTALVAG